MFSSFIEAVESIVEDVDCCRLHFFFFFFFFSN